MSGRKKSKWIQPANVLTMIGLAISLIGNFFLWQQNTNVKEQAIAEASRANSLQQQRDKWLSDQRIELGNIVAKIKSDEEELRRLYFEMSMETSYVTRESIERSTNGTKNRLSELRDRKTILEKQIKEFMVK